MDPTPEPASDEALAVRELVFEVLTRSDGDDENRQAVVEELCERWPKLADKLRRAVAGLATAGLIDSDDLPQTLGELRIIRRLGGGGMGVVLLAEQPSLGRKVAVKLLRTDELFREGARKRFQRETEAVARLAHPNVVAVHSMGSEGGVPYLVMDHVHGASLDRIIKAHQDRRPEELSGQDFLEALSAEVHAEGDGETSLDDAPPLFGGSWIEVCLRIVRDVAAALDHAHVRGVLHRDVKPSNVMVTLEGRVQLVDFGLAAVLDAERITRSGALMGSLPYVPPEELEKQSQPGARGDVYSLGVTLYELLILGLPFPGRGTKRLRDDIEAGRLLPARGQNPAVSAELETVLRCACRRDVASRYRSAAEFALDLTNLLEGRPIIARPARLRTRMAHWVRRRPAEASLACALGVILVGGPLAYGLQQRAHGAAMSDANTLLTASLDSEKEARQRADAHFERAAKAIDTTANQLANLGMESEPRVQKVRLQIVNESLELLGELLDDKPGDAATLQRVSKALSLRASLHVQQGMTAESIEDEKAAIEIQERLLALTPQDSDLRRELGTTRVGLGTSLERDGKPREAVALFRTAIVDLKDLCESDVSQARNAFAYGRALNRLASTLSWMGPLTEAAVASDAAVKQAKANLEHHPDVHAFERLLAQSLVPKARVAETSGDRAEAAATYRRASEAAQRALTLAPGTKFYQVLIVETAQFGAKNLLALGAVEDAEACLEPARIHLRDLLARYPSVKTYINSQVEELSIDGQIAMAKGDEARAVELGEAAIAAELKIQELYGSSIENVLGEVIGRINLAMRVLRFTSLGDERFARVVEQATHSIALLEKHDPDSEANQETLLYALQAWVRGAVGLNDAEAVTASITRLASIKVEAPQSLLTKAGAWALVADFRERSDPGASEASDASTQAIRCLSRAVEDGYDNHASLEADPRFTYLRDDERFLALIERMKAE